VKLVDRLADAIEQLHPGRRAMVAVDGPDAAGKTTLAAAVAARVSRPVVTASIDDWHHPQEVRYRRGRSSPDGYYRDSFDVAGLVAHLLTPFAEGAATVTTAWHDVECDVPAVVRQCDVPASAGLLFDGVFLQRPELRDRWDLTVYLDVPADVTVARALERDLRLHASRDELLDLYQRRYLAGQAIYRAIATPVESADIVIDNTDPENPQVVRWQSPPS
jgi:uridine kinase